MHVRGFLIVIYYAVRVFFPPVFLPNEGPQTLRATLFLSLSPSSLHPLNPLTALRRCSSGGGGQSVMVMVLGVGLSNTRPGWAICTAVHRRYTAWLDCVEC